MLALMVVSCTEFQEYESTTYGPGPTITLAEVSVQDSTFTISVTSSEDGHASVILLPGSGNTAPEDPEDLLTGNIDAMDYQSKSVRANEATNFTFKGLVQYAIYEVMGAANNGDGKPSEVSTITIGTDDTHAPMLTGTSPGVGYDPVLAVDGSVVLIFDEPVLYDDTKDLTFSAFYDGVDILAGTVEVDFNEVTITPEDPIRNREYLWLSYPEGAFTDHSGNLAAEMVTYLDVDAGAFVGLYWRAEAKLFEVQSVSPEDASLIGASAFDIVVEFEEAVSIEDVTDGDITLSYDDGLNLLTRSVLASELSVDGNELTIAASYVPSPGMSITLDIPEDILGIGIGNPNAEFTASWTAQLSLADMVGSYSVAAVSGFNPGAYDEVWAATVELVPGNDTALSITIDAGAGGGLAFLAGFNVDSMSIIIPAGTNAGDLYGYGITAIYSSDAATYVGGDVFGTITGANGFTIDLLGMYLLDYDNGDGTFGTLWDAFSTTWTKSATKAAVSGGINPAKAARF